MAGGIVGYLGYDMVRQMERLPADNPDPIGLPDAILLRPTLFAIFDNVRDELTLAAPARPLQGQTQAAAFKQAPTAPGRGPRRSCPPGPARGARRIPAPAARPHEQFCARRLRRSRGTRQGLYRGR